jgi:hypothetical protein
MLQAIFEICKVKLNLDILSWLNNLRYILADIID